MKGTRVVIMCAACALTASAPHIAEATAAAVPAPVTACAVTPRAVAPGIVPRQAHAVSRSGRIPGLGAIAGSIGWDNEKTITLAGDGFVVTRTHRPLAREVEVAISGNGEPALIIVFGGAERLRITRGGRVVGTTGSELAAALSARAVAAFREQVGHYERRLIAGGLKARPDDAHADGFLLAGAFLASLAGDPVAVGRARDLILRRISGKLRAVRLEFRDCVTDYELYLMSLDRERTTCIDAANDRDSWYARAGDRLACEVEFIAGALAGEGQFVSCTALGGIMI